MTDEEVALLKKLLPLYDIFYHNWHEGRYEKVNRVGFAEGEPVFSTHQTNGYMSCYVADSEEFIIYPRGPKGLKDFQ